MTHCVQTHAFHHSTLVSTTQVLEGCWERRWYNSRFIHQGSGKIWSLQQQWHRKLSIQQDSLKNNFSSTYFYIFYFQNVSLHSGHLYCLVQRQLKPVEKHILNQNPIEHKHFVDFSCLTSYFTTHFTTATLDIMGNKYFKCRHISIPMLLFECTLSPHPGSCLRASIIIDNEQVL